MSEEIVARVVSWSSGRERLYDGLVLYGRKTIFRAEERPTEAQARADVVDWCVRMGKKPRWEGAEPAKVFGNGGPSLAAAVAANRPNQGLQLATGAHTLTEADSVVLVRCEGVIERGLKVFLEVGRALLTIRDQRLYRYGFATFEGYVAQRWEMSARHAHRLCDAAEVMQDLGKAHHGGTEDTGKAKTLPLPANESQARMLVKVPRAERPKVWAEVVTDAPGGRVTAQAIEVAVQKRLAPPKPERFIPAAEFVPPDPSWLEMKPRPAANGKSAAAEFELIGTAATSTKPRDPAVEVLVAASALLRPLRELEPLVRESGRGEDIGHVVEAARHIRKLVAAYELKTRKKAAPRHSAKSRALMSARAKARRAKARADRFPKPSEHGVYRDSDAEKIQLTVKGVTAAVHLLEISAGRWIVATTYYIGGTDAGSGGCSSPLGARETWPTREQALLDGADTLIRAAKRDWRTPRQRAAASRLLEWAKRIRLADGTANKKPGRLRSRA